MTISVLFAWMLFSLVRVDILGVVNTVGAYLQLIALILVEVILLSSAKEFNTPQFVFLGYNNDTGFSSFYYVFALSICFGAYAFAGFDASSYFSDETNDPRNAPAAGITSE